MRCSSLPKKVNGPMPLSADRFSHGPNHPPASGSQPIPATRIWRSLRPASTQQMPAALLPRKNSLPALLWSGIQAVADHSRRLDPGFPEQPHRVPQIRKSLEYHGRVRLTVPKDPRWRGRLTKQSQELQSSACRTKRNTTGLAFTPAALIRPRLAIGG